MAGAWAAPMRVRPAAVRQVLAREAQVIAEPPAPEAVTRVRVTGVPATGVPAAGVPAMGVPAAGMPATRARQERAGVTAAGVGSERPAAAPGLAVRSAGFRREKSTMPTALRRRRLRHPRRRLPVAR